MSPRTPFAYQLEGAEFLADRDRAALLDDPGLGKSLTAMLAAAKVQARRVLILAPAIASVSWEREAALAGRRPTIYAVSPDVDLTDPDLCLVFSFDAVGSKAKAKTLLLRLCALQWDVLLIDEAHYLKNEESQRTRAAYGRGCLGTTGLVAAARRTWLLSGTLAPNHPGELWTHIRALFPRAFMVAGFPTAPTAFEWLKGVCNLKESPFGTVVVSARKDRLPALRKALEPYALRRRKADVLKDLPPLRITDEPLDMSIPPGLLADADGLLPMTDDEVIEALRLGGMVTATERRMLGLSKVGPAAAWTRLQLEGGVPKIILFAYHQDVLRGLQRQLADLNPLLVYGETPHRKRAEAEDLFQTDPTRRVWLGQFTASGTAITLTAADRVGVVEASWVPSDNYQAILRAHRIGQSRGVLASFLYVPNSLDQRIMSTFRRKAEELAALFD